MSHITEVERAKRSQTATSARSTRRSRKKTTTRLGIGTLPRPGCNASLTRNDARTRLVALAALSSAVQSETTFSAGAEFEQIIQILVPALLENIWLGKIDEIHLESVVARWANLSVLITVCKQNSKSRN